VNRVRALLELIRAPAALTVLGDTLAGAAAAGRPTGRRSVSLAAASVCLYWSGMALNDYADRHIDAKERPYRPIPSGRVSPHAALATASVLTGAGLVLAARAGGRSACTIAAPLAATVWAYDLRLKHTRFGPAAMATARALDVLMGAGGDRWRRALPDATVIAGHTFALTLVSRKETTGATASLPAAALAATGALSLVAAALPGPATPLLRATSTAVLAAYATAAGGPQLAAVARPDAPHLTRAVAAGIHALIPLQAALGARHGAGRTAAMLLVTYPLARCLSRKVSPT
jgi:hypothetical protein